MLQSSTATSRLVIDKRIGPKRRAYASFSLSMDYPVPGQQPFTYPEASENNR
jgi:hypothetical protein